MENTLLVCDDCGLEFDTLHACGTEQFCEGCAKEAGFSACSDCGEWFEDSYLTTYAGGSVCSGCAEASDLTLCDRCGDYHNSDDIHECRRRMLCDDCAGREGYVPCYNCGDWTDNQHEGADSNEYCGTCFHDRFTTCEVCDTTMYHDDACYHNDCTYCSDCVPCSDTFEPVPFSHYGNTYTTIGRRCYGVEIETDSCDDYGDLDGQGAFGAKEDCSVNGREFFSSILSGDKGLAEVTAICKFADRHGWGVNGDCGLHVHFDMRNENDGGIKAIVYAMYATYDIWKDFVEEHRHANRYCHAHNRDLSELHQATSFKDYAYQGGTRYEWLNLCAYNHHKTLEVRLHHGSIEGVEINNWIRGISLWMDWASSNGWDVVRNSMLCKDKSEKYAILCKVWKNAGCEDLIEWFNSKVCIECLA
jgi:hypothetical protein